MKTEKGILRIFSGGALVLLIPYFFLKPEVDNLSLSSGDSAPVDTLMITDDEYGFDRLIELEESYGLDPLVFPDSEPEESKYLPSTYANDQLFSAMNTDDWYEQLNAVRLIKNPSSLWPLHPQQNIRLLKPKEGEFNNFVNFLSQQTLFKEEVYADATFSRKIDCQEEEVFVCVLDELTFSNFKEQRQILDKLKQLAILHPMLLVYFGDATPKTFLDWPISIIEVNSQQPMAQAITAQAIIGANDMLSSDDGLIASTRLGRVPAESVGMNSEKLKEIDVWVEKAIRRKAMPGCQVLVAKSGKIVYEKSFGYHTYEKEENTSLQDVYDIASITKAAATTLGVMKLEEEGKIDLSARIRDYIPDYRRTSFSYYRVRHLLSHHTGLQGNLPIARYLNQDDLFSEQPSDSFNIALNKNFYIKNGMKESLLEQVKKIRAPRRSFFRYSDVNFILLQQLIEYQSKQSIDSYVHESFYEPLGLNHLQYLPGLTLNKDQIVPTERDRRWRHHLVHGEVHDESAVLLGGVGGHAGLFSNARDLAVLFQMLINGGEYGGERFLEPETINRFTAKNNYNYRAYGFDRLAGHSRSLRRYGASLKTFGHTGFTGTCVWADPENEIVFVFLSNRIHPSKRNKKLQKMGLRERLQKIIYQSMMSNEA